MGRGAAPVDLTAETPPRDDPGSRSGVIKAMTRVTAKAGAVLDDVVRLRASLGRTRQAVFGLPYLPADPAVVPVGLADLLDAIGDGVAHLLAEAEAIERQL